MQKTKSSSHTAASSIRPITVSSNFKFDKVEKLNQLVKNITDTKAQTANSEEQSKITNPWGEKGVIGEKVLESLKQRIKTNYDQLYSNYPDNKTKIFKQIQAVQTNIAGENHMNVKHEEVIKQKTKYDKLKAKIEQMQRKLKKLNDLRVQMQNQGGANSVSVEVTGEYQQKLDIYEQKKEQVEHNNLVLQEMLKQRKVVQLNLKERYNKLSTELNKKKEKIEKLALQNHRRKKQIMKIVEEIQRQQQIQIPTKLAQELSSKIQQYENKYSYNEILQHEAVLQEKRFQNMKVESMKKRQENRQARLKKQSEQKNKLEQMQAMYMIGNLQQEKLKKLCAAESINDVINCKLDLDQESLEKVSQEIQAEIERLTEENKTIQAEISEIIAGEEGENMPQETAEELNAKLQEQNKKKKLLQIEYEKKSELTNHWLTLMHLINNNKLTKQAQAELIKEIMSSQKKPKSEKSKHRQSSNLTEDLSCSNLK